ncbi:hypothetical protein COU78_05330 [Candidatus Peregrinibacteria bacterium CG10_big_fil_rev_8_21_14_0_10_49_24]|nr:MAG: hypothetical protein COV83_01700 [Candidatus Peregrinibacteria bacterium CG11_big_fil_rev_8_21_14_0_20_49_14]PIR50767.1 MAG: hypothetical protein COU78_05330 [Candidatus Peregrinibacteria bacterium CG10_big_fil_rev_8_21_14_0_10_49_24]PJA68188.1 MAG: hypothetical protein CO157_00480 [Candidatus Peregrinibacteria bacterium CG_4_9_14_3_um_filter_49_12]
MTSGRLHNIRQAELSLLISVLLMKCVLFYVRLGKIYGEDSSSFIKTMAKYRKTGILPDLKYSLTSYHPPGSFMLVKTVAESTGFSDVIATQIISFCSMLGAFFLLRALLKQIDVLYTPVGITFLYTIALLPILLNLSMASTYDSQVFFLGMLALYLSIDLFWNQDDFSLRNTYTLFVCALLIGTLFIGLMTKFTGLLFCSFPFIVILVRWKKEVAAKQIATALLICAMAGVSAMPYYYVRYYKQTGDWIPSPMEWLTPKNFAAAKMERDKHKLKIILEFITIPTINFAGKNEITTSLMYDTWYDVWKNDARHKSTLLKLVPEILVHATIPVFLFGLFSFLWHQRKRGPPLSDFGWILTGCAAVFILANLYFGYQNPYFPWRVFKAKYSPLTIVWIAYIFAVGSCALSEKFHTYFHGRKSGLSFVKLAAVLALISHTSEVMP